MTKSKDSNPSLYGPIQYYFTPEAKSAYDRLTSQYHFDHDLAISVISSFMTEEEMYLLPEEEPKDGRQ